nr:ATP-binding protein [uncultured Ruminococcus sp.]
MFIGREAELRFLEERYESNRGELVVLYGRRRVGKTETLRHFSEDKPHVFFSCRECTDQLQLKSFSEKVFKEDIPVKKYISAFPDWEQAFRSVLDLPYGAKKKLLIIDEFPYMCKSNTSIPSILQNLWDELLKDSNIMIVLCGSAMSFIEKELLAEKNPLYGRATGIYKMDPMGFYDAVKFFPEYSSKDKVILYSVLGGIPHYLKQFDPTLSLAENIKHNILTKGCALYSEVDFLLKQELRETTVYNSIIEAIALGATKLNEISQRSLLDDTSKTSAYLRNLKELGLVKRELSIDAGDNEKSNAGRGIYKLSDSFFRFWYAFAFTNISDLESNDVQGVYTYVVEPQLHQFASFTFEDICKEYMMELKKQNALPFRYTKMGRWFGKTTIRDNTKPTGTRIAETEIDILATSTGKKEYLVSECKFKSQPFSYSEYLDTAVKLSSYKNKADFYYALFSENGFDIRLTEKAKDDRSLYLYSLDQIVNRII